MTALPARSLYLPSGAAFALGLLWCSVSPAQVADEAPGAEASQTPQQLPRYHHSVFSWEHNVSAETLGIGDDPQSRNPTYTMGLAARPRYYLRDRPADPLSLRADAGLYREFTNSDSTTQQGEWSFVDTELALVYARRLRGRRDSDGTLLELRPLTLTLPTSKASFDSGRYFAAGVLAGVSHVTPLLRGRFQPDLSSTVRLAVGYKRWFARATVPTNPSLERVRLTPEGRSLPGDQLSGASLTRDQLTVSASFRLAFGENLLWSTDFGFQPAWKYPVEDEVEVCGVVATGCATVRVSEDDRRYLVSTQFNTELSVSIVDGFSFELGYGNAANQLGSDGRRRGLFYSPNAGFYLSLSFIPHELATPPKQSAQGRRAVHSL